MRPACFATDMFSHRACPACRPELENKLYIPTGVEWANAPRFEPALGGVTITTPRIWHTIGVPTPRPTPFVRIPNSVVFKERLREHRSDRQSSRWRTRHRAAAGHVATKTASAPPIPPCAGFGSPSRAGCLTRSTIPRLIARRSATCNTWFPTAKHFFATSGTWIVCMSV